MSKRHLPEGRAEADTAQGELRKPDDYSNQPGQSWTESDPDTQAAERTTPDDGPATGDAAAAGHSNREHGHGTGDSNTAKRPDGRGDERR